MTRPTMPPLDHRPTCLLSFDVEEHFHIEAARNAVPRHLWANQASRLEGSVGWLLQTLADHGATATFFILGWVARRNPALVAQIAQAGHEIACHGDTHDRLHRLGPNRLRRDLATSRAAIEDATGQKIHGYRAPTFSLTRRTHWAVDILIDSGFVYDSSVMPVRHPQYGDRTAPRQPYRLVGDKGDWIAELPPLTARFGPLRLAVAGGAYFRFLPTALMRRGIDRAADAGHPAVLYFHPWEFDPDLPRLDLGPIGKLRTYTGLKRTRPRFSRLLADIRTDTLLGWLGRQNPADWPIHGLARSMNLTQPQPEPEHIPIYSPTLTRDEPDKADPNDLKVA